MRTRSFEISLKGRRDYIQGPDLFNLAFNTFFEESKGKIREFEIAFHRMTRNPVELVWDAQIAPPDAFAGGSWGLDGKTSRYWIREREGVVAKRTPYYEDEITSRISYSGNGNVASLEYDGRYTDMEIWVSMIKAQHQRLFHNVQGKWVFARAKTSAYDPTHPPESLRIELNATLGTKLTRNSIFRDNKKVGEVFFALI